MKLQNCTTKRQTGGNFLVQSQSETGSETELKTVRYMQEMKKLSS